MRKENNISQLELANRAGITSQYVGYIERDLRCPTAETMSRLAIALGSEVSIISKRAEKLVALKAK